MLMICFDIEHLTGEEAIETHRRNDNMAVQLKLMDYHMTKNNKYEDNRRATD